MVKRTNLKGADSLGHFDHLFIEGIHGVPALGRWRDSVGNCHCHN